jgi:hypothetical protein
MEPAGGGESDETLDILVKHALNTHTPETPTPSTNNVWSKLSRRVKGPFGKIGIMGSGTVPFSVGDDRRAPLPASNSQEASDQHTAMFHSAKDAIQLT